jgi:Uncharacterized Fe-S protein
MQISEINIYPIKSLKGIPLQNSIVEKRGLRFDRRWMLVDPKGKFFTQREVPKMAAVTVEVLGGSLKVSDENYGSIEIPFEPDRGERESVTVWDSTLIGETYIGAMNEWFSEVLAKRCKLVRMPDNGTRHVSEKFDLGEDTVSFADGYPLLLIGEGSLAEVNERLHDQYHSDEYGEKLPLPMNRFRPNVVVIGTDPFEEDNWAKIRIGEAIFRVPKPCARCVMTTVDQAAGEFDGKEPLKTLANFRMAKDVFPGKFELLGQTANAVLFGENLIPDNPGASIKLGDEIEVLEFRRA